MLIAYRIIKMASSTFLMTKKSVLFNIAGNREKQLILAEVKTFFLNCLLNTGVEIRKTSVADLQRGMGGPLHGPEGAGGPERAPGWRKFVGRSSGNVEKNQIFTNKRPKSWAD